MTQAEGTVTSTPQYQGFGLWSYMAANSATAGERIWDGMIGTYAGIDFIETSTADVAADAGSGTVDTYTTTIVCQEALAMAFAQNMSGPVPRIVLGPVRDVLRRFATVGWFWMGGFGEFREEARHVIICASSIGSN